MTDRQKTGWEETKTWQTDRGHPGNRQRHGRQTEDRLGRETDMADRQRTDREDTEL